MASIGIIVLIPVFTVIFIILIFVNNGRPLFFQESPDKDEPIFKIMKFKTMTDKKDASGNLLPNEDRMTACGSFLRRTSLDETPQLINVLMGNMSLTGSRPLRLHYLPYYTKEEAIRHNLRPGITWLTQISDRNALSWDKKLAIGIGYGFVTKYISKKFSCKFH